MTLVWICGSSLRRVDQRVIKLLKEISSRTFDPCDLDLCSSDTEIIRIPPLPRLEVWTKFEEGR